MPLPTTGKPTSTSLHNAQRNADLLKEAILERLAYSEASYALPIVDADPNLGWLFSFGQQPRNNPSEGISKPAEIKPMTVEQEKAVAAVRDSLRRSRAEAASYGIDARGESIMLAARIGWTGERPYPGVDLTEDEIVKSIEEDDAALGF